MLFKFYWIVIIEILKVKIPSSFSRAFFMNLTLTDSSLKTTKKNSKIRNEFGLNNTKKMLKYGFPTPIRI